MGGGGGGILSWEHKNIHSWLFCHESQDYPSDLHSQIYSKYPF